MKTLYISDLDGTLLRPDQTVSEKSLAVLNNLPSEAGWFSVATARSLIGLNLLDLSAIRFSCPIVLMNGVMLYDYGRREIIGSRAMSAATVAEVLAVCRRFGKLPFVYRIEGNCFWAEYIQTTSVGEAAFLKKRAGRFPECFHRHAEYEDGREAVFFSMQDTEEVLTPLRDALREVNGVETALYKDNYMENNWYLEVFSDRAGKGNGVRWLKERLGAERVVAFGDNHNDLPMLREADVSCVVANGVEPVRREADVVIGSNEEDGVAAYIARQTGLPNRGNTL